MAILVRGDAMRPEDVAKAFEQIEEVDAVVSSIGGTPADPMADSQVYSLADFFNKDHIWRAEAGNLSPALHADPA